ncbi:AAC(3) family N-acetyltransferase [Williamsia sp.]|uniref:AAC(3) family N-acetyltransferase n=1 Tax=Williamsia sp. TaxID=1872085 RepID=UPI001A212939|nr:AAC(3) family N-acetyltransferase [Williamsia sp.]MBJ7287859.1 AAC(3) family N-acetyltransferase [Williamsia sp.]
MIASLTRTDIVRALSLLGLSAGDIVLCHSSLSSIGRVVGGAAAVVGAIADVVDTTGTFVVPTFSGEIDTPFTPDTPTRMGAIPSAVLAWPGRKRSSHPQASVAAVGAEAAAICARQPLAYALGADSPFDEIVRRNGKILLLGVGHNRSSMLHHSESFVRNHRRKIRRFPVVENGDVVWIETPDVGNDNDTYFPAVGAEFEQADDSVRVGWVGAAESRLFDARRYDRFAQHRLTELRQKGGG